MVSINAIMNLVSRPNEFKSAIYFKEFLLSIPNQKEVYTWIK